MSNNHDVVKHLKNGKTHSVFNARFSKAFKKKRQNQERPNPGDLQIISSSYFLFFFLRGGVSFLQRENLR